jgi:hypothetical protein
MHYFLGIFLFLFVLGSKQLAAQTNVSISPNTVYAPVNIHFTPGVFYVPKTNVAHADFMGNGIRQNCIRTNVIESVLNNTADLNSCLALLSTVQTDLQNLSGKCDKLVFIFEKMPAWLSSSSDGSPATTPGWYVLNTKPPTNWNTWQTVVDSITRKLVIQFGISNAYFEVWNEPDIGSWTGTMAEYFELYKRTYEGVKTSNNQNRVGGPAVNGWANNIYWKPPYGHLTSTQVDSSLMFQLIDSAVVWNKIPDFVSWHSFSLTYHEFQQAAFYLQLKTNTLAIPSIPQIVSEWNAPSAARDSRLASAFMLKGQLELSRTSIANNAVAAWQDFSQSVNEFHADYGLITYGGIHKPAYNSMLLSQQLRGMMCNMSAFSHFDGMASVVNDTLFVLLTNYAPPPFLEAFNHTLFVGQWSVNQLDSAGYIDIMANSFARLDSIYRGLITLSGSNTLELDINNAIPIYNHYDSLAAGPRTFVLNTNYTGNYSAQLFLVDSTTNNMQYRYDSLRSAGYTQNNAIATILPNQSLSSSPVMFNNGQYTISLQPNDVCLFKINIPGLSSIEELSQNAFSFFPNPAQDNCVVTFHHTHTPSGMLELYSVDGNMVQQIPVTASQITITTANLASGIYFMRWTVAPQGFQKIIKQ